MFSRPRISLARANRRSQAGRVVSSLVRKLNKQEMSTKNGSFHFFPTKVTDGSGQSRMATFKRLITCEISLLFISHLFKHFRIVPPIPARLDEHFQKCLAAAELFQFRAGLDPGCFQDIAFFPDDDLLLAVAFNKDRGLYVQGLALARLGLFNDDRDRMGNLLAHAAKKFFLV